MSTLRRRIAFTPGGRRAARRSTRRSVRSCRTNAAPSIPTRPAYVLDRLPEHHRRPWLSGSEVRLRLFDRYAHRPARVQSAGRHFARAASTARATIEFRSAELSRAAYERNANRQLRCGDRRGSAVGRTAVHESVSTGSRTGSVA